ncbi:MAG: hypothetical protein J6D23_00625 [Clostridia bacterium]|nr:hypothetical protein [Clostridia bacterium]
MRFNVDEQRLQRLADAINTNEIFEKDPIDRLTHSESRRMELINNIGEYVSLIYGEGDYWLELAESVKDCLLYYKTDKGPFTHYFLRSFGARYKKGTDQEQAQKKRVQKDVIEISNALSKILGKSSTVATLEDIRIISNILDIDLERVEAVIIAEREKACMSENMETDDDTSVSIFDTATNAVPSPEDEYIEKNGASYGLLDCAQELYDSLIASQKEVVSLCFTAETGHILIDSQIPYSGYTIISAKIIERCKKSDDRITEKSIARMLDKLPGSVNRTYQQFKRELYQRLSNCSGF